jgi:hypothetical protein
MFKYSLPAIEDVIKLSMPEGAIIMSAQNQAERLCIWSVVNTEKPLVERTFYVVGTGHAFPEQILDTNVDYVGTIQFQGGSLVLHVFEAVNQNGEKLSERI